MRVQNCWIVYKNTQRGPVAKMIELSPELAYEYIARQAKGMPISENEWSIFKTKCQIPRGSTAVPGEIVASTPRIVLG